MLDQVGRAQVLDQAMGAQVLDCCCCRLLSSFDQARLLFMISSFVSAAN